jgi:hypothetical protein
MHTNCQGRSTDQEAQRLNGSEERSHAHS